MKDIVINLIIVVFIIYYEKNVVKESREKNCTKNKINTYR